MMATLASLNVSTFVEKARRITAATSTWASRWKRLDVQAGYREHMCTVCKPRTAPHLVQLCGFGGPDATELSNDMLHGYSWHYFERL